MKQVHTAVLQVQACRDSDDKMTATVRDEGGFLATCSRRGHAGRDEECQEPLMGLKRRNLRPEAALGKGRAPLTPGTVGMAAIAPHSVQSP